MYAHSPGSMRVLVIMNQTLREIYHQNIKDIQIPLFMTYIISWRYRRGVMNSKEVLIITLRMDFS